MWWVGGWWVPLRCETREGATCAFSTHYYFIKILFMEFFREMFMICVSLNDSSSEFQLSSLNQAAFITLPNTHPCQCDPKWSSQVIQRDDITRSDSSACDTDSGSSEDDKQRDKQTQADKQTHKHTHTQADTQAERHIANPLFTRSTGLSQADKKQKLCN